MPDDFERFVYPGLNFAVPSDPKRYQERLVERFPEEARAIRQYFRDLGAAARWSVAGIQQQMMPASAGLPSARSGAASGPPRRRRRRRLLDRQFRSPQLKALLASQWGDYGVPPKESAFAIHALVAGSYLRGGWFPAGGAGRIARTFEQGIEASGGAIRVCQEATRNRRKRRRRGRGESDRPARRRTD